MSKHTPGPWTVSVKGRGVGIIGPQSQDFPLGEHIAKMTSGRPNIHDNARLIAAAPELLEACKSLLDQQASELGCAIEDMTGGIWGRAAAAIAKAEGRS